jgi:hypothetical protein
MGDRHDSFFGTAVPEHPSESRLQRAVLTRLAPAGASMSAVRSQRLPFRVLPDWCFPVLSWLTGQRAGLAREVADAGTRAHVHTDLRDDDLRGALIDPGLTDPPLREVAITLERVRGQSFDDRKMPIHSTFLHHQFAEQHI